MAKFQDIRALAKQQLQAVTKNGECWKAFLHTAAIAYNYNFPNQLLIYCQNPTATAVADMKYWNKEAGRQVKRGAHGIPILDVKKEMMALRYLFDISDTIPQARTDKGLPWAVTDQNWKPVWDKIIRDNQADSIQNALLMLSTSYVAQRRGMFLQALAQSVDGSSLQWAKPEEQQQLFLQLITQSCLYMAALRCGVDTQRLDLSAFDSVGQFDTKALAFCLGSACQRASKPLMHQIGSIAREIDSVARKEKVRYYGGEQAITNQNKEDDHGVQNGERVRDPEPDAERNAEAGDRQVRQYAQEISGGGSTDPVRDDADGGNAVPASGRDQQRSEPADRTDRAAADAADRSARPENGPSGLDAVDERTESPSRGTGDEANLQPVTDPSLEESVQTPSSFSIPTPDLPPLDDSLILGLLAQQTSTRADNADILAYFEKHPDLASRSEFCRTSYKQIYTYLYVGERMAGFIRHDQYLELWEGNYLTKTAQSNLTWDAVSDKIAALIEQGQLLVPIRTTTPKPELEQLTLTPEQSDAVGLSDSQKQQEVIEKAAKRKNWKSPTIDASGKYVTEQDITDVLCSGSGFAGGHFRLQEYFSAPQLPTEKEQADHLKKEYGIGGRTWKFADGQGGWVSYDSKGLSVQRGFYSDTNSYRRLLRWPEVAKRLRLLVHNDQYLTSEEKTKYNAWLAEQQLHRQTVEAALTHAKTAISDFCEREGLSEPDFSDLTHIDFAYSTTEDSKHDVQIYANLMRSEIRYEVDNRIVHIDHFEDNHTLAEQGIAGASFEDFIGEAEEAFAEQHAPQKAPEKKLVAAGDTVYLENDHPFTVEEIGIFDVRLRDEDFPLIGCAINRAEFARLLAANPKNNALAAPDTVVEGQVIEETNTPEEPVEGEVLEPTDEPAEETSSGFGEQVLQAAELIALKEAYEPNNYIPPQDPAPPRSPREKFAANITAIRTLKSIEKRMADGGPHANGEEQEILAQYSGWGGLSDAFEPNKDSWHSEYTELKSLLTEEEYAAARSSTLTAFYTPPEVIDAMYTALRKMGVGAGTILEPSMGVGAFFGQSHSYLYEPTTRLFGVELDSLTGRIARQLYQKANIQITGFEKADLPDSFFDVVILYESPLYERNLNTMMDMILECKVSEDSYDENRMDILFGELEQRDPHHPAVLQYRSFKLGSAKTLSSIMVTAVSNLHMLQSAAFAEMIATDEMFLPKLGVEKRAIFCVIPDNDDTFNFMVSILYTQLFDQLFRLADSTPEFHGTLPVHVRLMMDEFANVATPENFVKILAVARSRNISCDIILQNISQIKSKYKDDWETIIGNCDSLVYLGGNDYSTFEYISKLLGKQTIRTKGQSIGKGSHGSSSDSYQVTGRELMTPDEVRRMKRSDCLVMISGEAPVRDKKYNLFDHPNLKYTPDYRSQRGLLHRAATPIPAPEGYTMPPDYMAQAGTVSLAYVAELTCPEITEDLYDELQEWEESLL